MLTTMLKKNKTNTKPVYQHYKKLIVFYFHPLYEDFVHFWHFSRDILTGLHMPEQDIFLTHDACLLKGLSHEIEMG